MATVVDRPHAVPGAPPNTVSPTHEPGLDGLRGIAVAGVLLFHGAIGWATGGFLGVSTFFTLSGFLITTLLLREHEARGTVGLKSFWARRFRRLMPAAALALLLAVVYVAFVGEAYQYERLRGDVLAALFYSENWRLVFTRLSYASLFSTPSPVQHFWSLAIEEQFYLVFPLVVLGLLAFGRGSRRLLAGAFAALAVGSFALVFVLYQPGHDPSRVYYGSDTRALELIVGVLLAIVLSGGGGAYLARSARARFAVAALGLGALIGTAVTWTVATDSSAWLYRGGLAVYAVGTALVILAAMTTGPVKSLLSFPPLRALGRISYGVYLYHWPVFLWLDGDRTGLSGFALFVVRCAVTIGLAALSYRYVEQPIRSGRRVTSWRPWVVAPVAASLLVVVLVAVTANPPKPAVVFSAVSGNNTTPPSVPPGPDVPDVSRVLVVGDSVAQTLGRGLERWGQTHHVAVWNGGRYYCGVLRSGLIKAPTPARSCDQWPFWKQRIDRWDPQVVVVLTTVWDVAQRQWKPGQPFLAPGTPGFDDAFVAEYVRGIDLLTARGARVVILGPPCTSDPSASAQMAYERKHLLPRVHELRPDFVHLVDISKRVCPDGRYRSDPGGIANGRPDGVHFSDASSNWVAGWLMPEVVDAGRNRG